MSQLTLSSFMWPTAAHNEPVPSFESLAATSTAPCSMSQPSSRIATAMPYPTVTYLVGPGVTPTQIKTVHVTLTPTVTHISGLRSSESFLIHQTQPLELHASALATKVQNPASDVIVASFHSHTPLADPVISAETVPSPPKMDFRPPAENQTAVSNKPAPSSSSLSPTAIAAITLGLVAVLGCLVAVGVCLYRRRKNKEISTSKLEKGESEESLAAKVARSRDNRKKRTKEETAANQRRFVALKKKLVARKTAASGEYEMDAQKNKQAVQHGGTVQRPTLAIARRLSGLDMHPPTPATESPMEDVDLSDLTEPLDAPKWHAL